MPRFTVDPEEFKLTISKSIFEINRNPNNFLIARSAISDILRHDTSKVIQLYTNQNEGAIEMNKDQLLEAVDTHIKNGDDATFFVKRENNTIDNVWYMIQGKMFTEYKGIPVVYAAYSSLNKGNTAFNTPRIDNVKPVRIDIYYIYPEPWREKLRELQESNTILYVDESLPNIQ